MAEKQCPLLLLGAMVKKEYTSGRDIVCRGEECGWYTKAPGAASATTGGSCGIALMGPLLLEIAPQLRQARAA